MTGNEQNFLSDYSKFLDSSGIHLSYSALSVYRNFEHELSEKEKQFLKNHLNSCADCSARMIEVVEVEGEETQKQPKLILGIPPVLFRYAVAAVLVAAVGAAVYFTVLKQPLKESVVEGISPEHSIAQAPPDPAKFTPNQVLENFIERTVRSSSGISLLAPNIGDTLAAPFTFKWEGEKSGDLCTVTIVDNENREVWTKTTSSGKAVLERLLEPGLYYVKLEVDEKLAQVGKFVVVR